MIDIHNHTLYGVDDGPDTIEESIQMLRDAKKQGIDAVILTPHYRHGMFPYPKDRIEAHFEKLREAAEQIPIHICLGCEYHVDSHVAEAFQSGRCLTLAEGDYVLAEYSYDTEYSYIVQSIRGMINCGYIPVIAHAERYRCFFSVPKRLEEIRHLGALVQINADSVIGEEGLKMTLFCRKALKNHWVDLVASDAHGITERANHLAQSRSVVLKKYGEAYTNEIFYQNPKRILGTNN